MSRNAIRTGTAMALCAACALAQAARAGTPACYVKKGSWAETMLASRAALGGAKTSSFEPFVSGVLRGGDEAVRISLDVTGLESLWLVADIGPDNYNYDQAAWGEPELVDAKGERTRLSDLKPSHVKVGWGNLLRNKDHQGKPLRVAGKVFGHGFWAHAPSELCFPLGGKYVRFEAWAGIGAAAGRNGSVVFKVLAERSPYETVWNAIKHDFPEECALFAPNSQTPETWFASEDVSLEKAAIQSALEACGDAAAALREEYGVLVTAQAGPDDPRWLSLCLEALGLRRRVERLRAQLDLANLPALRLAIEDLARKFPETYPGERYLAELTRWERQLTASQEAGTPADLAQMEALHDFRREVLLANPLLDFKTLLLIRRDIKGPHLGLPANWQGNCSLPRSGYDDVVAALDLREPDAPLETVFRPETPRFVGDLELGYDADNMLFSMPDDRKVWQVWEAKTDGTGLRIVTPASEEDVDNYDACYLPDGRILYGSTAPMRAVPCVDGSSFVANLYRSEADGSRPRQLCFDQDHDWCPTVLHNGRVLYLRWEYTDTPHSQTRLLFHMNPDGTGQMEYYGSNSFWPNGVFYARPVPGHPTKVAGIVTGHHGVRRMGELVVFDPARGRHEADGVVQRIASRGERVEPIIKDQLVNDSWPKFLHPYPISEDYFVVSAKPTPDSLWGIYLADTFDNLLLIAEQPGYALFEPTPLKPRPRQPVIADRADPGKDTATVYLADVYVGEGLAGVPRGTVKALRVFAYNYAYRRMGGLLGVVGMDGPWDIKQILGTVPVHADGSALFEVPANTPVSVQPLDEDGRALQLMRSWFTAMPGEVLSCVGCHERQNMVPPSKQTIAATRTPSSIEPWHGPARGFSFAREVQPVLDAYCVSCHQGETGRPDFRGSVPLEDWSSVSPGRGGRLGGQFSLAYAELHRYVRRPGIESDYHMLSPLDFHAGTTELVQMLEAGHAGVRLDAESWDRLVTWIDLNAPYHGYWHEVAGDSAKDLAARQGELAQRLGGNPVNQEIIPETPPVTLDALPRIKPQPAPSVAECPGWPFTPDEARRRQAAAAGAVPAADGKESPVSRTVDLGGGVSLELTLIPAGQFVMGGPDTGQRAAVIGEPFWMGRCEVSNAQYARFRPEHDSRVESKHSYQFGVHGFPLNEPEQPVVRVSCEDAQAFCAWLSERTGERFALPTESQWEYACRAGAETAFHYGGMDADFSGHANLADAKLSEFADDPYHVYKPLENPTKYDDWIPKDARFNDGVLVTAPVGSYQPNAWGLHDMHGNVWEWTRSGNAAGDRFVCGGSWYDRPMRAHAGFRLAYPAWQRVFNTGFRVVCPAQGKPDQTASNTDNMERVHAAIQR